MATRIRSGLASMVVAAMVSAVLAAGAGAGQMGGSILYSDHEAAGQELEFRARGWDAAGGYFRAVIDYREIGSTTWLALDENWGWTRRSAIAEITKSARYLALDGNIWRFVNPGTAPRRAVGLKFTESCWRASLAACRERLTAAWERRL